MVLSLTMLSVPSPTEYVSIRWRPDAASFSEQRGSHGVKIIASQARGVLPYLR